MKKNINRSITFIYTDKGEYLLYENIAKEAVNMGYKIRYSENIFDKDDIVFYCQHECYPQHRSKLSLVMLHDLGQAHGMWPNIWIKENWNKFDIGLLPNKNWVKRWTVSSGCSFANPKIGCFEAGWPKADMLNDEKFIEEAVSLADRVGLNKNLKTVLYAPSWENDNKQLDFVKSLEDENVNMLIKQYPCSDTAYPVIYKNIQEVNKLCKGRKNVYILEPETNIFTAILLSDILVSDESSTLLEAMFAGKVSVSVTDWLIPDVDPPRLPCVPYEFVIKTQKNKLNSVLLEILNNYDEAKKNVLKYREENIYNIGSSGKKIMDIIDACVQNDKEKLSALKLPRSNKKIIYSIKKRFLWNMISYRSFLIEKYVLPIIRKYCKPDSNNVIYTLYIFYKKCRRRLKKI